MSHRVVLFVVVIHHLERVGITDVLSLLPGVLLVSCTDDGTVVQDKFELRRGVDCGCGWFTHRKG